jgi:hypothetical protein
MCVIASPDIPGAAFASRNGGQPCLPASSGPFLILVVTLAVTLGVAAMIQRFARVLL